jgi:uncharacterized protein
LFDQATGLASAESMEFRIEALPGVRSVKEADWSKFAGTARGSDNYNPFISHAFLSALELSACVGGRTGWQPRFLKISDTNGAIRAAVPAYLKSHSQGEYVFDHGWADAFQRAGGQYYPKLQISVPFTPATGPRLLAAPGDKEALLAAANGVQQTTIQSGLSSAHLTFIPETEADLLGDNGFLRRTDQQFHFFNRDYRDYQDFLHSLASRKRKALRKEREGALANGLSVHQLTGTDLTEDVWDQFYSFYSDTGNRKWGRPYLTREFFSRVGELMADDILLVMAKRNGRYIAGAINFVGGTRIFGRNWGCIEDHPFLHFEVCYHQAIDYAIAKGLKVVEAGAQGEHKLARGYQPVTTQSAHYIPHDGFRRAVADYLRHERAEIARVNEVLGEHTPFRKGERLTEAAREEE